MKIGDILRLIYNILYQFFFGAGPYWGLIVGVFTGAAALFHLFNDLWGEVFTRLDAITLAAAPGLGIAPFALANGVFPLDTFFTYLTSYFALYLACSVIRIIKSFIPTISG